MDMPNDGFQPKKSIYDDIVNIKREQVQVKKEFTSSFLNKIEDWFTRCYLNDKEKREFFVTKERLTLDLLKILQSQKKFKDSELIQNQVCSLAVFDKESNLLGKIVAFDLINNTVSYITMASVNNSEPILLKKLNEIDLFDPHSLQMEVYYKMQKIHYDGFEYINTFNLITGKEKKQEEKKNDYNYYSLGRGIALDKKVRERINNIDLKDK